MIPYSSFVGVNMRAPVVKGVLKREIEWITDAAEIKKNNHLNQRPRVFQRTNEQFPD